MFDAELEALQTRLGARPLGEGAGLGLLGSGRLSHPVTARGQHMYSDSVHFKSGERTGKKMDSFFSLVLLDVSPG